MVTGLSLTRVYLIFTLLLAELKNVDPVRSCGQVPERVRLQHAQEAQDHRRLSRLCSLHWHFPGQDYQIMNHVQAPVCTVLPFLLLIFPIMTLFKIQIECQTH
jgi:hypothetical protein